MRRDPFAKRERNGRKQRLNRSERDKSEREMISVVMRQPHRMLVPDIYRSSQHAENPIGRLFLLGAIDAEDVAAAVYFRSVCVLYHRAIGAPGKLKSSSDLERVRHFGSPSYQDGIDDKAERDRWHGIAQRYNELVDEVKSAAGDYYNSFVRMTVEDVNEDIPDKVLRACLSKVANITKPRRSY